MNYYEAASVADEIQSMVQRMDEQKAVDADVDLMCAADDPFKFSASSIFDKDEKKLQDFKEFMPFVEAPATLPDDLQAVRNIFLFRRRTYFTSASLFVKRLFSFRK